MTTHHTAEIAEAGSTAIREHLRADHPGRKPYLDHAGIDALDGYHQEQHEEDEMDRFEQDAYTFIAWPEHGCFVEEGKTPEDVGAWFAPMNEDGTPDPLNITQIEVAYSDA